MSMADVTGQGEDAVRGMDAIEPDAGFPLRDVIQPSDLVTGRDDAPTDAVTESDVVDAGVPPSPVTLTGSFVGGAVNGTDDGISLVGHFHWSASVSGSNEGITLEGLLR